MNSSTGLSPNVQEIPSESIPLHLNQRQEQQEQLVYHSQQRSAQANHSKTVSAKDTTAHARAEGAHDQRNKRFHDLADFS